MLPPSVHFAHYRERQHHKAQITRNINHQHKEQVACQQHDCRKQANPPIPRARAEAVDQHAKNHGKDQIGNFRRPVGCAKQQKEWRDPDWLQQRPGFLRAGQAVIQHIELGHIIDYPTAPGGQIARNHRVVGIIGVAGAG